MAGAKRLARAADFAGLLAWRKGTQRRAGRLKPAATSGQSKVWPLHFRVHSLPSRGGKWPQWLASTTFALQSRGGDGVAPSSRARSPRLMWRGKARCGLRLTVVRAFSATGRPPNWVDEKTSTYSKKALHAAGRRELSPRKAAPGKPVREFHAGAPSPAGQREDICHAASGRPGRRIRRRDSVRG